MQKTTHVQKWGISSFITKKRKLSECEKPNLHYWSTLEVEENHGNLRFKLLLQICTYEKLSHGITGKSWNCLAGCSLTVSNQVSSKLLLLVGIHSRTFLTLEVSWACWKIFWEEMPQFSFSEGFLACGYCSVCRSSDELCFFCCLYIVYATQYITLTAAKAAGNTALA